MYNEWPMYVSGNTYARKPGAADTFILVGNVLKELGLTEELMKVNSVPIAIDQPRESNYLF